MEVERVRSHTNRRRAIAALSVTPLLVATTACELPGSGGGRSTDGPLTVLSGSGGTSIAAPAARHRSSWFGSFGVGRLCTDGREAHIQAVRNDEVLAPRSTTVLLRSSPTDRGYISALGSPPEWDEPYVEHPDDMAAEEATYTPAVESVITADCDETDDDAMAAPKLVLIFEAGKKGSHVSSSWIDYVVDGNEYTAEVPWEMILCGSQTQEYC